MAEKTVTRADLCEAVYQKIGLSRTESAALVELVLKEITDCLEEETERMFAHSQIFRSCDVRYRGGETVELVPKSGYHVTMTYRATPAGRVA